MDLTSKTERISNRPLDEYVRERSHLGALKRYLIERGHARHTLYSHLDCTAHFSRWTERIDLSLAQIDEAVIARFRDHHLARCDCRWPKRSDRRDAGAALGHLLLVLRTLGVTAPSAARPTPVDEELRRFDEHMDQVRGLAPKTRRMVLRIVGELLHSRFHDRPVVISAITPEYLRNFFARLSERYHAPASAGSLVARAAAHLARLAVTMQSSRPAPRLQPRGRLPQLCIVASYA